MAFEGANSPKAEEFFYLLLFRLGRDILDMDGIGSHDVERYA
jgi:hypothetical protein